MEDPARDFLLRSKKKLQTAQHSLLERTTAAASPFLEQAGGERRAGVLADATADKLFLAGLAATFHSIKGTSGFLGFTRLIALAIAGRRLVSFQQRAAGPISPDTIDALSMVVQRLLLVLSFLLSSGVEMGHEEPAQGPDDELIAHATAVSSGDGVTTPFGTHANLSRVDRVSRTAIEYVGVTPLLHFEGSLLQATSAVAILKTLGVMDASLVVITAGNGTQRVAVAIGNRLVDSAEDALRPEHASDLSLTF